MQQAGVWTTFRRAILAFVQEHLRVVVRPDKMMQETLAKQFAQNSRTLEYLGFMDKSHRDSSKCLLGLIGCGNWSQPDMVFVAQAEVDNHADLCAAIASSLEHLVLKAKPAKPAQSRWTGVPNVARFVLSQSLR
jgi:hypothetical protein